MKTHAKFFLLAGFAALSLELTPLLANASPEQDTFWAAKSLRPISDSEWNTVAGPRVSEKYEIIAGDTLSGISKRLFGDTRYWPKLYALNNDSITNPHLILPGNQISFMPGSGTSLPGVSFDEIVVSQGARSEEWKKLPRQNWESTSIKLPSTVNSVGFDTTSRINTGKTKGYEPYVIAATSPLPLLGQIFAAHTESEYLSPDDKLYIRADQELQVGEVYAVTSDPFELKATKSNRTGYSYPILGKVKIVGVRDGNLFVARIVSATSMLNRGTAVIAVPARIPDLDPVAAPESMPGSIFIDPTFSTFATAQFGQVFIDRGTDDGIQPGMVFRVYEHYDPANGKKITSSDLITDANLMVVQTSEKFCTALIVNSRTTVTEKSSAVLLTDVSDVFGKRRGKSGGDLDELDLLDNDDGLGAKERRELEQLEKWKGNPPPRTNDAPAPSDVPTPTAEPIPPAPEAELPPEGVPLPEGAEPLPEGTEPLPETAPAPTPEAQVESAIEPSEAELLPPPPPPASEAAPSDSTPPVEETKTLDEMLNQ